MLRMLRNPKVLAEERPFPRTTGEVRRLYIDITKVIINRAHYIPHLPCFLQIAHIHWLTECNICAWWSWMVWLD